MSDIQQPQRGNFWEGLLTGGYSAGNELLFGLPDFLVNKFGGSQAAANIRAMRDRNALANTIGTVGGIAGGMLIPGGAIARGAGGALRGAGTLLRGANTATRAARAGTAAGRVGAGLTRAGQALTNAGRFAAGTGGGVGRAIGRGAIQAAEQAIPRALIEGADTGDWGNAGLNAVAGVGLGAGIGGLTGAIAPRLGRLVRGAGDAGSELAAKSGRALAGELGVTNRIMRGDLARNVAGGLKRSNRLGSAMDESTEAIINTARKFDLMGEAGRGDRIATALQSTGLEYGRKMAEALKATPDLGQKAVKFAEELLGNSSYSDDAVNAIKNLVGKYDVTDPNQIGRMREALSEKIRNLMRAPGRTAAETELLDGLQAVQATMDDALNNAGGQTMRELGKEYRALKNLQMGDVLGDLKDYALPGIGSNTQTKQATERLVSGLLSGTGVGGASALLDVAQGKDVDIGRAALASLGGTVGGAVASKALQGLARKGLASGYDALKGLNPLFQDVSQAGQSLIDRGGAVLPGASAMAGILPTVETGSTAPDLMAQAEQAGVPPGEAQAIDQEATEVAASDTQGFSPTLMDRLQNRMNEIYANEYQGLMSREQFDRRIAEMTNNLTDKASLGFLLYDTPEEMALYSQRLATAERLGGIDVQKALRKGGIMDLLSNEDELAKAQRDQLEQLLLEIRTGGDVTKTTKADRDEITRAVSQMQDSPEMMQAIMAQYGLDFNDLAQMGVI